MSSGQLSASDRALLDENPDLPVIDTSDRRLFRKCRRAWELTSNLRMGLQPIQEREPIALAFGSAIHAALDYVYQRTPPAYHAAASHFEGSWDAVMATIPRGGPWPSALHEEYTTHRELGINMMEEYAQWALEQDDFEVIASERAAIVPLRTPDAASVPLLGFYYYRTDGLVKDSQGRYWILEHKTARQAWSERQITLDDQLSAYCWAEQQTLGEPVAGILMNFLYKRPVVDPPLLKTGQPTTAMSRLGATTAARYEAAMRAAGATHSPSHTETLQLIQERESYDGHPTLGRQAVYRSQHALEQQRRHILQEFVAMAQPHPTPNTPNPGFQCSYCSVYELCSQMEDGADWAHTARTLYQKRQPRWAASEGDA